MNLIFRAKEQYECLQIENADIRKNMVQLEEDRADVVAYLKQVLNSKIEEIAELDTKLKDMQEVIGGSGGDGFLK